MPTFHSNQKKHESFSESEEESAAMHDASYLIHSSSLKGVKNDSSSSKSKEEFNEDSKQKPSRSERIKTFLVQSRPLFTMLLIDVALPLALYYILKIWISVLAALLISGIPPLLYVIYVFWKKRRVDILGCIFVVAYVVSAVLSITSGNVRLTLLRDSATTGIIGFLFLVTLIPLRTRWLTVRPFVCLMSQQMLAERPPARWTDAEGVEQEITCADWIWQNFRIYRKFCYYLTAAWGVLLIGEFVAKVCMIESSLSLDQIILYGNIIVIVVVVSMTVITMVISRYIRKRIEKEGKQWYLENDYSSNNIQSNSATSV